MIKQLFISCLFMVTSLLHAQNPAQTVIEQLIEDQIFSAEEEIDVESLVQELEYFSQYPINLNATSAEELSRLYLLNDFQIRSLLDYRKKMGQIISVYELSYIFGFNEDLVIKIQPFVYIGPKNLADSFSFKPELKNSSGELLLRTGYRTSSPDNYDVHLPEMYTRYIYKLNRHINAGILAENDLNEPLNNYGFDHYSGFVEISELKYTDKIVLGEYRIRLGQGLLIWNGFSPGKTSETGSLRKKSPTLLSNTSKNEFNFLRGAACVLKYKNISLTVFSSMQNRDGNIDTVNGETGLSTIYNTGYHRTASELENKNSFNEITYGTSLKFKTSNMQLGLNSLGMHYNLPVLQSFEPYKTKSFFGTNYLGWSADYSLLLQQIQVYGETAVQNQHAASVNGINFMPVSALNIGVVYRYYPAAYYTPYPGAFSETGKVQNEEGIFIGMNWSLPKGFQISAFTDRFTSPWLSYTADGIARGYHYDYKLIYQPTQALKIEIKYRLKAKMKNFSQPEQPTNSLMPEERENLKLQASYMLSEKLNMKTRFEWCKGNVTSISNSNGYLLFQDVNFKPDSKHKITARYAFFTVPDYSARIYAYENDVLYGFSVPAYYGNGWRAYILYQHNLNKTFSLWFKYEHTEYFDKETVNKNGVKFQTILKF
ncbi:MAG: helix-hairpin-helix domain-containing protein [Bacteroidales bacterium]|nr:helix-hairpin-helix domain-containing protein [Bacteroidales bacterium]MBN2818163.1 helix-hairpin-helix domain-containing protein [Bacteroidales bacterium]